FSWLRVIADVYAAASIAPLGGTNEGFAVHIIFAVELPIGMAEAVDLGGQFSTYLFKLEPHYDEQGGKDPFASIRNELRLLLSDAFRSLSCCILPPVERKGTSSTSFSAERALQNRVLELVSGCTTDARSVALPQFNANVIEATSA